MNKDFCRAFVKVIVTIVDRGKGQRVADIFLAHHLHFHFVCLGLGTAGSEILDYFGIGETDKDVVFSLVPAFKVPELLDEIVEKMQIKRPGHGIAFSMPLSGISALFTQALMKEQEIKKEGEVLNMECDIKYDLILTVINHGYSDQVMEAAKKVGATGGTILHAREIGHEETEKFFGISIHPEKEIVAILVKRETKHDIMQAISQAAGINTPARGLILSLPVDNIIGIEL